MVCGLISLANSMVFSMVSRGLARQPEDEGAVDHDAELAAVLGEAARDVGAQALLDVQQDLVVAGFVADQQQAQAVFLHDLQRLVGHVGLGVAGPGHAQLAQAARDLLDARLRESVKVSSSNMISLTSGMFSLIQLHLCEHVLGRAHAVAVTADGLRPQAEGAFRAAAAAGVEATRTDASGSR